MNVVVLMNAGVLTKVVSKQFVVRTLCTGLVCLVTLAGANGQTAQEQKPQLAEDVFKNVQILRGIPVDQFMGTMGFFSAALGMNCIDCHTADSVGNWAKFAADTPVKQTARKMILMMNTINKGNFAGMRMVTCDTCHRGTDHPETVPSLAEQYATPAPMDPDKDEIVGQPASGPSADQIIDRYMQAIGGAQQAAKLTSFIAKGTYVGYDTDEGKVPVEVYAKAPAERTTIVHTLIGDIVSTYDGHAAWVASIDKPLPLLELTGGNLDGAQVDAEIAFPALIKRDFTKWRGGFPPATIGDRDAQVVEGTTASGARIKLYFDKQSGLLVRQVRFINTLVGLIPMHFEYSDYRDVAGVKMPFHWEQTWTDGQSTTQLTEVQPNAPIDDAKFGKPAPAPPPKLVN